MVPQRPHPMKEVLQKVPANHPWTGSHLQKRIHMHKQSRIRFPVILFTSQETVPGDACNAGANEVFSKLSSLLG